MHQVPFAYGFLEPGFEIGDPWWEAEWPELIAVEFEVGHVAFFSTSPFEMRFSCRSDDLVDLYDLVPSWVVSILPAAVVSIVAEMLFRQILRPLDG